MTCCAAVAFSAMRELVLPAAAAAATPPRAPLTLGGMLPTRREGHVNSAQKKRISDLMDLMDSRALTMRNPNPGDGRVWEG